MSKETRNAYASCKVWSGSSSVLLLETDQVGELDEELFGVVDEAAAVANDFRSRARGQEIDVLRVPVVADKQYGSGVHQIGEQEIRVQVLAGFKRGQVGVGQRGVVLKNHSKGKLPVELPVPLRTNDVVIEDAAARGPVSEPGEKIVVVNTQLRQRTQRKPESAGVEVSNSWLLTWRRNDIEACSPGVKCAKGNLREIAGRDKEPLGAVGEVAVAS